MAHQLAIPRRDETIVVVPCYNEAARLDVSSYSAFLEQSPNVVFVFVDDGSTDDTPLVIERLRQQYPQQVRTLRLSSNVGKAEAVRRGINAALRKRPAIVGYWDADLATPLDAIQQFCDVLASHPKLALVMGSRVALLGRQIQRSGWRHVLGRAFATAASRVLRLPVYDTQCGAKLFRVTPATSELFARPFGARWIFDVEILARLKTVVDVHNEGAVHELIYECPLERWQDVRGSRLTPLDFFAAAVDLAAIYWRYTLQSAKPASVTPTAVRHPASDIRHRDAA